MRSIALSALLLLSGALSGTALAAPLPTSWHPWGDGWVRLEADGNLSCLSFDGMKCAWDHQVRDPRAVDPWSVRPLVCGSPHMVSKWGVNGYNDGDTRYTDRHWCRAAYATLFANWQDYTVLGRKALLSETPAGDVMCYSTNGKDCTPATQARPGSGEEVHPLVCGAHHTRMHGGQDGYGQPGHWCRLPKLQAVAEHQWIGGPQRTAFLQPTLPWTAEQQPALVVEADLKPGQSIAVGASVAYQQALPVLAGGNEAFISVDLGGKGAAYLSTWDEWSRTLQNRLILKTPWEYRGAPTGPTLAAMAVTARGNVCVFGANANGDRFFENTEALWGNSQQIARLNRTDNVSVRSSSLYRPLIGVATDSLHPVHLKKVWIATARLVPESPGTVGPMRRIPYLDGCDAAAY